MSHSKVGHFRPKTHENAETAEIRSCIFAGRRHAETGSIPSHTAFEPKSIHQCSLKCQSKTIIDAIQKKRQP
jgi:hypothetical protein